jgi:RimJ/RimL family protein N-acetyltransferase
MRKVLPMVSRLDKMGLFFLADLFTKSAYYIKVNGFGAYLKTILLLIAEVFVKRQEAVLFEKDLSQIPRPIHPKGGVNIEIGTLNDVPRLTRLLPQWSARIFRDRLLRGDIFFIAQIDNQIVHQVWISFKDKCVPLLNKKIVLREGETYLYHSYTAPEFRGKNVLPAVISKVLRHLKAQGYKRLFFLVDLKAHQSIRAYKRISGTNKGTIISYWRILGYRNYRYEPYRGSNEFRSHVPSVEAL